MKQLARRKGERVYAVVQFVQFVPWDVEARKDASGDDARSRVT